MKTFKTIASLLVGTVSSLLLMGCGEIDTGTETSAWEKETATIVKPTNVSLIPHAIAIYDDEFTTS